MGFLSALKGLFSTASGEAGQAPAGAVVEEYKGYSVQLTPQREGGQYRVSAIIRKGEQEHRFIRSDLLGSEADCLEVTRRKVRTTLDQLGDQIFN